jgi:hypothetical protein
MNTLLHLIYLEYYTFHDSSGEESEIVNYMWVLTYRTTLNKMATNNTLRNLTPGSLLLHNYMSNDNAWPKDK